MMEEIKTISLRGDKIAVLKFKDFDGEVDVEDITSIHYHNIIGDMLTFPTALNRVGNLLAEIDAVLRESEFNLNLEEKELKKKRGKVETKARAELKLEGVKSPTLQEVDNKVFLDEEFKEYEDDFNTKKLDHFEIQYQRDVINNLYWSCKSKEGMLNAFSAKIKPEDFEGEIADGVINGIQIQLKDKLIK